MRKNVKKWREREIEREKIGKDKEDRGIEKRGRERESEET